MSAHKGPHKTDHNNLIKVKIEIKIKEKETMTTEIQKFSIVLLKSQTELIASNPSLLSSDALGKSHLSLMASAAISSLQNEPVNPSPSGQLSRDIILYLYSQCQKNQEVPPLPESSKA